ncbi:dual specificity protein kinase zak2-like [Cynara cardunculus var. scolymus]|uniref:dual specificity protein kinase zak2-like n=1 Tax=Cynara cardunculus var. scolymus TaxID=59895 RepID=UPI000D630983|nr:dual specificity protein kinase zak2-like [Cynara cardunculus var. scolymus]
MSFQDDFKHLKIQLKDVRSATNNFGDKPIGKGGFGKVYKGQLFLAQGPCTVAFKCLDRKFGQGDTEFWKEIMMLSKLRHQNLVSLLCFCNDDAERIIVYEYASRGSLDRYLGDASLTWTQRLQICHGAACGLNYLHDPMKTQQRILHRDIKSSNILLDEKWNAKVSDFGLSKIGPANQPHTYLISNVIGTPGYCDPLYWEVGLLSKESDVYSFGVVLFEVMCGRLCYEYHNGKLISILVNMWKKCYNEKRLDDIIHLDLKEQIDQDSLKTFSALANRCLNRERRERPTMVEIVKELEVALQQQNFHRDKPTLVKTPTSYKSKQEFHHLQIQLKYITSATDNFSIDKLLGRGPFGPVYKGELYLQDGRSMVACKRLDRSLGRGNTEFWREVKMLSKYKHENLISLLGFCDESDERILVYEYAPRGTLGRYLSDTNLTWVERLKICIGVARALSYLHDPVEIEKPVIHRDVKSAIILLDENWTPKVTDFGLSKIGLPNEPQENIVGTIGYCDPSYWDIGFLSKESDVYSFGVVLFEVMCGRLCFEYGKGKKIRILVPMWKKYYEEKRLDDIIYHDLKEQTEHNSLYTFSAIAYRCLKKAREERPPIAEVVKELEIALEQQELFEKLRTIVDLVSLPPKGIIVGDGKTWLSMSSNGITCEMISAIKCISADLLSHDTIQNSKVSSFLNEHETHLNGQKFSNVVRGVMHDGFKVEVKTQFLLPRITYTVNLVFKHSGMDHGTHIPFKFKFDADKCYSNACISHVREDGWLMIELRQFTSYRKEHEFKIEFLPLFRISSSTIQYFIDGIEFRPVEYVS